jgi:hypothetical protein
VEVGNGSGTFFWTDRWINGHSIGHIAPSLLAAVPKWLRRRSVSSALANRAWAADIRGARTVQVILGYLHVDQLLQAFQLQPGVEDRFVWRFGPDGAYSASSAYRAMFFGSTKLRGARQLWKASAPPKVKFFFWLAIHNRCWTAARRKKRGLQDCDLCALCHQAPETMNHLLTDCVYTREVWARLRAAISLPQPALAETTAVDQWLGERKLIPKHLRRGFDALFLLVSWMIWKERNSRIFEWSATMPAWLPPKIFELGNAWIAAGFKRIAPLIAAASLVSAM